MPNERTASRERLLEWVTATDGRLQDHQERVEGLAAGIRVIAGTLQGPLERRALERLAEEIDDATNVLMNCVNSEAEEFGANYKS